jgi:hypothetical protein
LPAIVADLRLAGELTLCHAMLDRGLRRDQGPHGGEGRLVGGAVDARGPEMALEAVASSTMPLGTAP